MGTFERGTSNGNVRKWARERKVIPSKAKEIVGRRETGVRVWSRRARLSEVFRGISGAEFGWSYSVVNFNRLKFTRLQPL